jgi:hypothetical protein
MLRNLVLYLQIETTLVHNFLKAAMVRFGHIKSMERTWIPKRELKLTFLQRETYWTTLKKGGLAWYWTNRNWKGNIGKQRRVEVFANELILILEPPEHRRLRRLLLNDLPTRF